MAKRLAALALFLVALVIAGTLTVLGLAKHYFDIDVLDKITVEEAQEWTLSRSLPYGTDPSELPQDETRPVEKIPRIIHQTWKTNTLPERWSAVRDKCLEMHPDYEYMLWTDERSRDFISQYYPWFLDTWDGYTYPIQRADAIRYFVLHHYGGVYVDLDIGCRRPIDPLLNFEVILPHTTPIGISNDLIFSAPRHPFMEQTIYNLITFDHTYGTNYPTVMFSTGPMFLSAQYNLWPSVDGNHGGLRVLPKALYGKNAKPEESEFAFFWHYYGSSWHANDAGFIQLLGKFGMFVLYGATGVVLLGCLRLVWSKRKLFHGRPAGPISLPFTPSATDFLNGYITPSSSRPTSPLPYSRDIRRRSSSSPTPHAPNLLWVPMYMDAEDRHKAPTLTFDPSSARWARSTPEHQADCDNASLHSLHTIKASARNRWSQAKKSTPSRPETSALTSDESTSEDDVESQRFLPSKRRRPRGPLESSSGLPPSYGGLFSNWAASIFRPSSSQASPDVKSPTTPNDRQCTSALMPPSSRPLSRGSSFSSEPPAYPEDLESSMDVSTVDRLLSEMDPQSRER